MSKNSNTKKRDAFQGKIGNNIPPTKEEREEDILEEIYLMWRQGKGLTPTQVCRQCDITKRELNYYVRQMVAHGYLTETQENEPLELTSFGKVQGEECFHRHHHLSQFIQLICRLDEKDAEENACRLEHVVSDEVIRGISDFMNHGDTYDRVIRNANIRCLYEEGSYEFSMGIYHSDLRYPRALAEEYYDFEEKGELEVCNEESFFYLKPKRENTLWYKLDSRWIKAEATEKGIKIPSEALAFSISPGAFVIEGEGIIAFTQGEDEPKNKKYRELNVHL